ncbi:hypothetical protein [Niallia nealsonii]|uniref:Uncharacterized protein n=1 Tax=Niallia nealsonii TaxID=115979 RepID=A0A2N0YYM8_9BACI|nr:hypothetical protein [Niallia nealsonii]PKG22361.1 hypothetical protein CWS01_17220 [Niallia nealsonii]
MKKYNDTDFLTQDIELAKSKIKLIRNNLSSILTSENSRQLKVTLENALKTSAIISDWRNEKMSHGSMILPDEYSNDGTFWATYIANDNSTVEAPWEMQAYIPLVKFNIVDPNDIKKWKVLEVGSTFGGFTQSGRPPYEPNLVVLEDKVLIIFNSNEQSDATDIKLATIEFDKNTETFGNYNVSKLTYTSGGSQKTIDMTATNVSTAYRELGYILSSDLIDALVVNRIIKYNNYYYGAIASFNTANGLGFKGMVIRSLDV